MSRTATTELVGSKCSLGGLSDALRRGCDILYVVCHGLVAAGQPQLLLEDGLGRVERVPAEDFVTRLRDLQRCPQLVIFVTYRSEEQTAGEAEGNLAALGPQLAGAGVPAVVAMQGDVSMATVATFIPSFFAELKRGGQIDAAMAVARGAVRDRQDWWAPTLFMRLKTGRLWYAPGFGLSFERWPTLLNYIANGQCTPILGPGVIDSYIGPRQDIARRWASTFHFPMAPPERSDLPQVAQYMAVSQDTGFPYEEFQKYVRTELLVRYGRNFPDNFYALGRNIPERNSAAALDDIFSAVAQVRRRERELCEPHSVLAELPLPLFVTTQPTDLMEEALRAVGKDPQRELCRWKEDDEDISWPPWVFERDPGYQPDEHRPLVFHLFGHLRYPGSMVLTEDDYFNFLIRTTANEDSIPLFVRKRLSSTSLLLLGFRLNELDFQVVFRGLVKQETPRRARRLHLMQMLDPEEEGVAEPIQARMYLNYYFRPDNIRVYWGDSESLVRELGERWGGVRTGCCS